MTTIAAQVPIIRRLLQDEPLTDTLAAAIAAAGTLTMTVTDVTKHAVGTWWEVDDSTGDKVLEEDIDQSTSIVTIRRGYRGSTAVAHSDGAVLAKAPRFEYDTISQAINSVLDQDLWGEGIYNITTHQVTSSADTFTYDAPTANCAKFLDVYQQTATMQEPHRTGLWFSQYPTVRDTGLYATGLSFDIRGNQGTPGSELYYVTCAHASTITDLNSAQQRIVQYLACANLLEWTEPKRIQGPNNQGDTTIRPGVGSQTAAYWRGLAEEAMSKERRRLENYTPSRRRFVRNG